MAPGASGPSAATGEAELSAQEAWAKASLNCGGPPGTPGLPQGHVQELEAFELMGAPERPGVDRAQSYGRGQVRDGLLGVGVVADRTTPSLFHCGSSRRGPPGSGGSSKPAGGSRRVLDGKTRAVYEAVAGQLADWQLDYPLDPVLDQCISLSWAKSSVSA